MSESNATNIDKAILLRACDLFFRERKKVTEISKILNREFLQSNDTPLTREKIHPLLASAEAAGVVRIVPPLEQSLPVQLGNRFQIAPEEIRVVNAARGATGVDVVSSAAWLVIRLIEVLCQQRRRFAREKLAPIGLVLGPVRATEQVCRELGNPLRRHQSLPDHSIQLHAITAGGPVDHPEYAPNSFFHLLPQRLVRGCVGLFAETLVTPKEFATIKRRGDIADAFKRRKEIDIVVTSRGSTNDADDLFCKALKSTDPKMAGWIRDSGWLGNVQYRPYAKDGPVAADKEKYRGVTLFELSDFQAMATTKNKYVVLIARRCSLCENTGIEALLPLLTVPELKVWSHIVMDLPVAKGLLESFENGTQSL